MDELQLFRGDTVLVKGKKRQDTVSLDLKVELDRDWLITMEITILVKFIR